MKILLVKFEVFRWLHVILKLGEYHVITILLRRLRRENFAQIIIT